eukprot:CAMPEP_0206043808 /NCGR_PEP_ID=MMETSP1466-20131121/10345_1 /ASSEMBLY_ACC=CAM_ASM_001126 /TAXON_ID=44452 /ORGANISM="Pavlova gyrans, Strain CCMP608" /LENGTH=66 /DNA_ID=CAMNT_0053418671 /DNA_START=209 /DNA_END=406 /DNA_ORIENTATION=-
MDAWEPIFPQPQLQTQMVANASLSESRPLLGSIRGANLQTSCLTNLGPPSDSCLAAPSQARHEGPR